MSTAITTIENTVAEYQRRQNDPVAFLDLHTDETVVVNIAGRRVLGKDELRRAMTAALASPLAQVRTTLDIEDVRFPAAGVALVSAIKHVHDDRDDRDEADAGFPATGALALVLVERDGGWKVASAQTTPRVAVAHTTPRQPV